MAAWDFSISLRCVRNDYGFARLSDFQTSDDETVRRTRADLSTEVWDLRNRDGQISDIRLILRPGMYLSLTMDNMMVGDFSTSLEMTGGFARRSDYNWKVQNMSEKIVYCWFVKHMLHRAWWNHGVYLWEISIQAVALGSSYNLDNYIFWVVFWNLQKRRNNAWHKSVRYPCDDCVLLPHCVLGGKRNESFCAWCLIPLIYD